MFTEADHAKAVELWRRYKDDEWWPETLRPETNNRGELVRWMMNEMYLMRQVALSAIAWAMVERLGAMQVRPAAPFCDITGIPTPRLKWEIVLGSGARFSATSLFLALSAAIEAQIPSK